MEPMAALCLFFLPKGEKHRFRAPKNWACQYNPDCKNTTGGSVRRAAGYNNVIRRAEFSDFLKQPVAYDVNNTDSGFRFSGTAQMTHGL